MHDGQGLQVLLIDQDEKALARVGDALSARGHRVFAHPSLAAARKPFVGDLILLSLGAVGGDLSEAVTRLRGVGPRASRVVVGLLASRRELAECAQPLSDCTDLVLVKPLSEKVLWAYLETAERLARWRRPQTAPPRAAATWRLPAHQPGRTRLVGLVQRALAANHGLPFAVLHLDIDHFRSINFTYGYDLADQLLEGIAARLAELLARQQPTLAKESFLAYLGGDEFAIFATPVGEPRQAAELARGIQETLTAPFRVGPHDLLITASCGIAMGNASYQRAEEVLRDADTAMERAKSLGGASWAFFSPAMRESAAFTLRLEADLRRAPQNEELSLVYQPIVAVESGELVGFEALARWQNGRGGPVPPADFIPVAEQTGLIIPLDRWVLRQVCRQVRTWISQDRLTLPRVSVNISGVQFLRPDFVTEVDRTLRTWGLYGDSLCFEITESAFVSRTAEVEAMLQQLNALRVSLSIDDFGTGYSSLAYLQRLGADALKIDRSFIGRMTHSSGDLEIVRAIIRLAQSFNKRVVAEGVETSSQLELLRSLDCHYAQGRFFYPPLSPVEATALLKGRGRPGGPARHP